MHLKEYYIFNFRDLLWVGVSWFKMYDLHSLRCYKIKVDADPIVPCSPSYALRGQFCSSILCSICRVEFQCVGTAWMISCWGKPGSFWMALRCCFTIRVLEVCCTGLQLRDNSPNALWLPMFSFTTVHYACVSQPRSRISVSLKPVNVIAPLSLNTRTTSSLFISQWSSMLRYNSLMESPDMVFTFIGLWCSQCCTDVKYMLGWSRFLSGCL